MPKSVLIIDDNAEDRYLLKRYLKKSGLQLTIAEVCDGEQGLEFLLKDEERGRHDADIEPTLVIFLDVNMPLMDGWQFLELFREKREQIQIRPTVVVMYSTSDLDEDKARCTQYDFVKNYVVKGSYSADELKDTLVAACNDVH
ncbi:MAG: response regulator [Granulosicoccus sp.]